MSWWSGRKTGLAGLPVEGRLPGFDGAAGWLNSPPLGVEDLRGKVVLVDFWTYTCINWLRTLGHVRAWAEKYRVHGLVVVGVHTPEFPFEKDPDNVREAASALRVEYPIALDPDYAVWTVRNCLPAARRRGVRVHFRLATSRSSSCAARGARERGSRARDPRRGRRLRGGRSHTSPDDPGRRSRRRSALQDVAPERRVTSRSRSSPPPLRKRVGVPRPRESGRRPVALLGIAWHRLRASGS